jgi:hypothetical protein
MALGSTQPLTEMSARILPGGKGRPELKADFTVCADLKCNMKAMCSIWNRTAVIIGSYIFCGVTPCSPLKINRRFGETCRVHLKQENSTLPLPLTLVSCLAYSSTLKMEATCPSETSVDFQRATRPYIAEEGTCSLPIKQADQHPRGTWGSFRKIQPASADNTWCCGEQKRLEAVHNWTIAQRPCPLLVGTFMHKKSECNDITVRRSTRTRYPRHLSLSITSFLSLYIYIYIYIYIYTYI